MRYMLKFLSILYICFFVIACNEKEVVIDKDDKSITFYEFNSIYKKINLSNDGFVESIQTFKNNKLDSEWIADNSNLQTANEFYGNGQIKVKGYLKNNKKHGLWSYFDRNGHLIIDRYFSYDKPTSIWIWYDHYNHKNVEKYELYEDLRDDGRLTRYFQSSNIKEIKSYTNNQLNGEYFLYHDNKENIINIRGNYLLGTKVGNWELFDRNGKLTNHFE